MKSRKLLKAKCFFTLGLCLYQTDTTFALIKCIFTLPLCVYIIALLSKTWQRFVYVYLFKNTLRVEANIWVVMMMDRR